MRTKIRTQTPIICKECGQEKKHHSRGLCHTCYHRHYNHKPSMVKYRREYYKTDIQQQKKREWEKIYTKTDSFKMRRKERYRIKHPVLSKPPKPPKPPKIPKTISMWKKHLIVTRGNKCECCGHTTPINSPFTDLEVHRLIPAKSGGTYTDTNSVVLCTICHKIGHSLLRKGNKNQHCHDFYGLINSIKAVLNQENKPEVIGD